MTWLDILRTAFHALRGNWMRSALTSLGVIIGIAAVIVMVSVAFIAFLLFQYVGDPVTNLLGQDATPEQRQAALDKAAASIRDVDFAGIGTEARQTLADARAAAVLTVGEKGTATDTATAAPTPEPAPGPAPFVVDRAFAYSVVDTATGMPLMMGTVNRPGA